MSNWIDKFKKLVISSHKRHIIVADQDSLFDYAELIQALELEGYQIFFCKTDLAVRVAFELQIRNSDKNYLIVAPPKFKPLPDIELEVHFLSIGLPQLFTNLDSKAIKGLSYNALCLLSNIKPYENLGYEGTLKFLLENLYNIDFDTLSNHKAKERILNALITVFLERDDINVPLTTFLSSLAKPYFPDLVSNRLTKRSLVAYMQEQWTCFVSNGSSLVDFEDPLISKSLGYLFVFEHLSLVKVSQNEYDAFPKSLKIGVFVDEQGNPDNELDSLIEYLRQQLDVIENVVEHWFKIIQALSNAKLKFLVSENEELKSSYLKLEQTYNLRFQRFIDNSYNSLFSLSGVRKPVVVSRILEHINANPEKKNALIVIDGMSYWQWVILSKALDKEGISCSSNASLAYIPTITAWSRQSIFRGDKPNLEETNSKEAKHFEEFWTKKGMPAFQVDFIKFNVNTPLILDDIPQDITTLGLVCNDLDDIMHGSILGDGHLKMSTEQWILKSKIVESISGLRKKGFCIYITSDHGSVESRGMKNLTIRDKIGALSRSKRHLHFTNEILLQDFLEKNPIIEVGRKGLSLFLKEKEAFTIENSQVITHGGSHFWEVIIPFITIHAQ